MLLTLIQLAGGKLSIIARFYNVADTAELKKVTLGFRKPEYFAGMQEFDYTRMLVCKYASM